MTHHIDRRQLSRWAAADRRRQCLRHNLPRLAAIGIPVAVALAVLLRLLALRGVTP